MKIYTKTGDLGETGLFGGRRIPKDDALLEAYGTVDELNAIIGLIRAESSNPTLDKKLARVQSELFDVGADLASPFEERSTPIGSKIKRITGKQIHLFEEEIDESQKELKPLQQFILPGGTRPSALLHHARTVCRRAERRIATLAREGKANPAVLIYMNRLSDWLFVMARWSNQKAGVSDTLWETS